MQALPQNLTWKWAALLLFGVSCVALCAELLQTAPLDITTISVQGTNLVLGATVPPGLEKAILEVRPALTAPWEPAAEVMEIPSAGGPVTFSIPKPDSPMAFFRLNAQWKAGTAPAVSSASNSPPTPRLSAELAYITTAPLAASPANGGGATFHFRGTVDGSDRIVITHDGALWEHVHWSWPQGPVTVNGTKWNPRQKNYLTTGGTKKFLPESFSLDSVKLEVIHGRDVVALERGDNTLIVYLNDTPPGSDDYEFSLHFLPSAPKTAPTGSNTVATLKLAARIDGSDFIKITSSQATWEHRGWGLPSHVTLNGMPWLAQANEVLKNEGRTAYLPPGIDFSTAKIVSRKGRDLATMRAEDNALLIWFADNPNGSDNYELEISFGK